MFFDVTPRVGAFVIIRLPACVLSVHVCGLLLQTSRGLCVYLCVTAVTKTTKTLICAKCALMCAKPAEPIKMPFGVKRTTR